LTVARSLHVLAVVLLASLYTLAPLHPIYLVGVAAVAALLVYEHSLVSADDLSRVDAAFFTVNGWISIGYLIFTILGLRLA
jgi:4-hydroxybenzoate polyprenyltransferase